MAITIMGFPKEQLGNAMGQLTYFINYYYIFYVVYNKTSSIIKIKKRGIKNGILLLE
jgi:hypothetical protein